MKEVDVFVSHKMEDTHSVLKLKRLVEGWGFSCYVDAEDPQLIERNDPVAVTTAIRRNLRSCRCLIYAFSTRSVGSKWMPWELGFFDGRWGGNQIGLYDLDQVTEIDLTCGSADPNSSGLMLAEYLKIYTPVNADELRSFIAQATSTQALADRADVDVDRVSRFFAAAMRNPLEFWIGCLQFHISLQRSIFDIFNIPTNGGDSSSYDTLNILAEWRRNSSQFDLGEDYKRFVDSIAAGYGNLSGRAIEMTATPGKQRHK